MSDYYTHRPYLKTQLDSLGSKARVLELGTGDGSGPLMQDFCQKNPEATVTAIETDGHWYNKTKTKYSLENYNFLHFQDWSELQGFIDADDTECYDLVFVDQAPWQARTDSIDLLKHKTKVFVVHDYDYFNGVNGTSSSNTYICDESSWWGKTYANEFNLVANYNKLPPTLIMEKI